MKNTFRLFTEDEKRRFLRMTPDEREALRKSKLGYSSREVEEDELEFEQSSDSEAFDDNGKKNNSMETGGTENTIDYDDSVYEEYENVEAPTMDMGDFTYRNYDGNKKEEGGSYNSIYLNYIVDGTYSFTQVFPGVYYAIRSSIKEIKRVNQQYKAVSVKYGLTVFHENAAPVIFQEGYFTSYPDEFLKALENIAFYGGSEDGKENINEAIEVGIRTVENHSPRNANRGIFFFTDSLPRNIRADFRVLPDCKNQGLRFAEGYLYDWHYNASFNIVDGEGKVTENGRNEGLETMNLIELLQPSGIEHIQKLVADIMKKASVMR